ncbi:MAG: lamin tail domain-containing protein, partial [Planctomycetes bacterium]|nr:lamin tail domain-containing protein [Planctomycetota bacterium]
MSHTRHNWIVWLILSMGGLMTGTQSAQALIISEIMYNPVDEQLEYVELFNHRAVFEDLGGYAFTNGIEYTFAPGTILEAHEYLVIALDPNAMQDAYGLSGVLGPYAGKLSNGGERVDLSNANGGTILSVRY